MAVTNHKIGGSPASLFNKIAEVTAATTTANDTNIVNGLERYTTALFMLDVTAASGTTPTLVVRIQRLLPDGNGSGTTGTWQDLCAFTSVAATGKRWYHFVTGATQEAAVQTGALTAASAKNLTLGGMNRVQYTIGGTNPSFTFDVYADYYE